MDEILTVFIGALLHLEHNHIWIMYLVNYKINSVTIFGYGFRCKPKTGKDYFYGM